MSLHDDLLAQVGWLAKRGRRPRHADIKRATSTAYYALFHALAFTLANTLIGIKHKRELSWARAYRTLDHGKARQEFKRLVTASSPGPLRNLAPLFVELQELRHEADYAPGPSVLTRADVLQYGASVQTVVDGFAQISPEVWRELASVLLFKDRR